MTATARADADGSVLRSRLAALRRRLRLVAAFRGTTWLVTVIVVTLLLAGLADFRWHLPGLVRATILTALLVGAGCIIWRLLLRPLSEPADDLSLALRVEERYPGFNDALASTIQFIERDKAPDGESTSMRQEAVRRTLGRASGLDFNRVIETRGLRSAGLCALLAMIAGVSCFLAAPTLALTAVARLASPFASIDWPRKTQLDLERVVRRIGRNKEYRLQGTLRGVIPREVTAVIDYDGFPSQRKPFTVKTEDNTFVMHLKPDEVQRNFRFRIIANDFVTPEFAVEVLPLPTFVAIDGRPSPQVELHFPPYTDLPSPQRLSPGSGNVEAIAGTVVTVQAAVDRRLKRAWIEFQPEVREAPLVTALASLGDTNPLGVVSSLVLARRACDRVAATLSQDGKRFQATFRPALNGMYAVHFEDENELENSRLYEMRLRPDPAPSVRLERPSPTRDVLNVLPTAELPLHLLVEDPQFAIRTVFVEYRTRPDETPRVLPLYDHAHGLGRDAAPLTGLMILPVAPPRLRLPRLEFQRTLALRHLRHADGSALKEGDVVILQAGADDFDAVSVGKLPGMSHQVEIRIVGRDALELTLNQEQGKVQQELLRLREKQREALNKIAEAETRLRKGGKLSPEREALATEEAAQKAQDEATAEEMKAEKASDEKTAQAHRQKAEQLRARARELARQAEELKRQASQFSEAEQLQQQIRERIGDQKEGLRGEIERIRETLRQNGLESSNAMDRMKMIASELDRLAEKELEAIEPKLVNARKLSELQDEKVREERRAELLKRSKEAEQEARAAEETAKKLQEQANRAEQSAEKAADPQARSRAEQQAKQLRQRAREQEQAAAEKRAQAQRDREDANQKPDPARVRQALAEARRGQEEVEKSLNALLQELEPHSSTREIRGEAGRLRQEQKELMAQLDEMERKGLTGKGRDELTEGEKADLDSAQDNQRRLAERAQQLVGKMKRLAEDRAEKDPETATELQEAVRQAEEGNLAEKMKDASGNIGRNQLNRARQKQREAMAELEKLVKNLEDRREAELDRLIKKLREAEKKVEELLDEQERLQKKMREAGKIANAPQREQELQKLARRQQELQQKTKEVLEQLSRLRSERARQALGQAGAEMGEAARQLGRGQRDDDRQEDVLDRLDEARRELERARKKAEEELGREQLARVADVIKRLRDRQAGHGEEGKRIQEDAQKRKGWSFALKRSLQRLGENERGLAEETRGVARKDLGSAPVFARLLERAGRAMEKAGDRFVEMSRQSPPVDQLPDASATEQQQLALRRLDQLLNSVKEAQDEPRPLSRSGGDGDGGEEGGGGGDDGLPPMAQLKLLRAMQKEVNERTEAFRKKHPDPEKLGPKEQVELQDIRKEQKEVADLLDQLTRPAGDDPRPDGGEAREKDAKEADR